MNQHVTTSLRWGVLVALLLITGTLLGCLGQQEKDKWTPSPPNPIHVILGGQQSLKVTYDNPPLNLIFKWTPGRGTCSPQNASDPETMYKAPDDTGDGNDHVTLEILRQDKVVDRYRFEIILDPATPKPITENKGGTPDTTHTNDAGTDTAQQLAIEIIKSPPSMPKCGTSATTGFTNSRLASCAVSIPSASRT